MKSGILPIAGAGNHAALRIPKLALRPGQRRRQRWNAFSSSGGHYRSVAKLNPHAASSSESHARHPDFPRPGPISKRSEVCYMPVGASAIERLHACALLLDRAMGTKSSTCLTAGRALDGFVRCGYSKGIARAGGATARILVRRRLRKGQHRSYRRDGGVSAVSLYQYFPGKEALVVPSPSATSRRSCERSGASWRK